MAGFSGTGRFVVQAGTDLNDLFFSKQGPTSSIPFNIHETPVLSSSPTVPLPHDASSPTRVRPTSDLYFNPKPTIVRRPALGEPVVYEQKISLRFLQPPPVPPPGPLIIKEVRPAQPPPPPPLVIRQHAPPLPALPPLILRERPPIPPPPVASQTVIRYLPAAPSPLRSVIIERHPPLPAKPRDIFIERWIPYGPQAIRRSIVQRASTDHRYPPPRNLIILYDPVQVRVVRKFQRLDLVQENPQAYISHYRATLLDTDALIHQARAAGVTEDISPPVRMSSDPFNPSTAVRPATSERNSSPFDRLSTTSSQGFLPGNSNNLGANEIRKES